MASIRTTLSRRSQQPTLGLRPTSAPTSFSFVASVCRISSSRAILKAENDDIPDLLSPGGRPDALVGAWSCRNRLNRLGGASAAGETRPPVRRAFVRSGWLPAQCRLVCASVRYGRLRRLLCGRRMWLERSATNANRRHLGMGLPRIPLTPPNCFELVPLPPVSGRHWALSDRSHS